MVWRRIVRVQFNGRTRASQARYEGSIPFTRSNIGSPCVCDISPRMRSKPCSDPTLLSHIVCDGKALLGYPSSYSLTIKPFVAGNEFELVTIKLTIILAQSSAQWAGLSRFPHNGRKLFPARKELLRLYSKNDDFYEHFQRFMTPSRMRFSLTYSQKYAIFQRNNHST